MSLERIILPNGELPRIIQGGMGVAVSNWNLAKTVSMCGHLGVVSGTGIDPIVARRLQDGDKNHQIRDALSAFPIKDMADEVYDRYFIEGGKKPNEPYKPTPFPKFKQDGKILTLANRHLHVLTIVANFVEVYLAKKGHGGLVGINFLYKIQSSIPQGLYGAMLAGVDAVLIGAGFPKPVPDALDALANGRKVSMPFPVTNGADYYLQFNPEEIMSKYIEVERPAFLGIVSNQLAVKGLPNTDGYILEGPTAGGHNAPPRVKEIYNELGEPVYGAKDEINWKLLNSVLKKRESSQPYWLAGGYSTKLDKALELGATGIQVGTPFAFSKESGIESGNKKKIIEAIMNDAIVFTNPRASSSGFPIKELLLEWSLSKKEVYMARPRICDQGYLLEFFEEDGIVKSRCSSEPVESYLRKGGKEEETLGKNCLCNSLIAVVGHASVRKSGYVEVPFITIGNDLDSVRRVVDLHGKDYCARDVIRLIESSFSK